jgi:hypothetical protein
MTSFFGLLFGSSSSTSGQDPSTQDAAAQDAFEGDSGIAADSQLYSFDHPDVGDADLNTGVAGTTVRPNDEPVEGAQLNTDMAGAEMDPQMAAGMSQANAQLGPSMLDNMRGAISDNAPPSSDVGSTIPPISGSDQSIPLPDQSQPYGASSSSVSGFPSSLTPWNQSTSMAMSGSPPSDDPSQVATQQAMDKSLSGWGDSGGSSSNDTAQQNYGTGFDDSVWSGIDGVSTVGQDQAAGDTDGAWSNLGGWTTVAQDDASGANTPGTGFNSLGGSEGGSWAGNTAYMPDSGPESRGYDEAAGSNLIKSGDLYSANPSFMAKLYSG